MQAFPLQWPSGWPRTQYRKDAKFGRAEIRHGEYGSHRETRDITMEDAMKRVRSELGRLGVNVIDDMVVSTNLKLNLAGLPRGDQGEPGDPGVAVYWNPKNKGPMRVIAVDLYRRVRDNLAAIAATLEAMRAIERHGGAQIMERAFTGFTALPEPGKVGWRAALGDHATLELAENAYRTLAKSAHTDAPGGNHDVMVRLNAAIAEARQFFKEKRP
jgi:hypothetical protein